MSELFCAWDMYYDEIKIFRYPGARDRFLEENDGWAKYDPLED